MLQNIILCIFNFLNILDVSYGYPSTSPEGKIIKTVKGREYTVLFPEKGTIDYTITIPMSRGKRLLLLKIHLENMQK